MHVAQCMYLCSITAQHLLFSSQNTNIFKSEKRKCFFKSFELLKKSVNLKEIIMTWILINFIQGGSASKLNGSEAQSFI